MAFDDLGGIQSRGLLVRMLTYAIRCPQVAQIAVQKLDPAYFDSGTQFEFQSVWLAAKLYWEQFGSVPPMHATADLALQIMVQQDMKEPILVDRMQMLVAEIYTFEEDPWNVAYGRKLLSMFFDNVFSGQVGGLSMAMSGAGRDAMHSAIENKYQSLRVSDIETIDPFDFNENDMSLPPREPCGLTFVDLLLGGGMRPTECYGVLGPSGGGKTVLSVQLANTIAARHEHVEYFTYEQPGKEMRPRILSCAAGVKTHDLEDGNRTEAVLEKLRKAREVNKSYFHLHDRAVEGDNIEEVGMIIQQSIDAGRRPRLVVIDWIWPLIMRMTAKSTRRDDNERKLMQRTVDLFKSMAAKYHTSFWLVHQLSIESAKKSPGKKPQWFNSAEAGSFAWFLHYCFAIGMKDPNGLCWLVGSKARSAKNQDTLLFLNGAYNRFDPTDKRMVYDPRNEAFVAEGTTTKISTYTDDGSEFAEGEGGGSY